MGHYEQATGQERHLILTVNLQCSVTICELKRTLKDIECPILLVSVHCKHSISNVDNTTATFNNFREVFHEAKDHYPSIVSMRNRTPYNFIILLMISDEHGPNQSISRLEI